MNTNNRNRHKKGFIYLLLTGLIVLLVSGCRFWSKPLQPTILPPTRTIIPQILIATRTPVIQTATRVTSTPTVISTPTATRTSEPTFTPTQVLPGARFPETPVVIQRQSTIPTGQIKILLLGADLRPGNNTYRTDSIVLLTLNPQQGTASLLSIPPALYVNIPEVGMEHINSAIAFGGAGKVIDTIQNNLGVRPDKYLTVDLNNFTRIIEYLGSIDVNVASSMTDRCDLPHAADGWCTATAGLNRMDKDIALWYIRSANGGEFNRLLREQQVFLAVFTRLMTINADTKIEELYATFHDNVETDISVEDLHNLVPLAKLLQNPDRIHRYSFTAREAIPFTLPGGDNVLLLDQNAAWELINFVVFTP